VDQIGELALKALNGGVFVVAFALVGEVARPKRFAGIFSAAPSVALANLLVVIMMKGTHEGIDNSIGMLVGAVAMVTACAVGARLIRDQGALKGSVLACAVWLVVAVPAGLVLFS
jgi:hypothetical protein